MRNKKLHRIFLKHFLNVLNVKELHVALSVLMLCAPVFIFTSGSSTLFKGAHGVVYRSDCCYLAYSIHLNSEFLPIFEKTNKTRKIFKVYHFHMIHKWLLTVTRHAKHSYWDSFFRKTIHASTCRVGSASSCGECPGGFSQHSQWLETVQPSCRVVNN